MSETDILGPKGPPLSMKDNYGRWWVVTVFYGLTRDRKAINVQLEPMRD